MARAGVSVSLIEASSMLGGTMTDGGVFMPNHWHSPTQPVVQGIGWELFNRSKQIEGLRVKSMKERYGVDTPGYYSNINVPIYASVAEQAAVEAGVEIHYHEFIGEIVQEGNFWIITSYARGIKRITKCREVVDCSGDADVTRALGLAVDKSPKRQPGTLEYRIEGVDMQQVWEGEVQKIYEKAMEEGELEKGDWAYFGIYHSNGIYKWADITQHIFTLVIPQMLMVKPKQTLKVELECYGCISLFGRKSPVRKELFLRQCITGHYQEKAIV